jgi:TRAP-type C4-dicarboxylate transport system permease small subunit
VASESSYNGVRIERQAITPAGIAVAILRWLDANLEKTIILTAYTACAGIIAVEVLRRFLIGEQVSWSTSIPAYMFVWLTWPGAAYGVKIRAHLAFAELRSRFPRPAQYALMQIDYILFLIFAAVAIYFSYKLLLLQQQNFSTVPGTLDTPTWWFYMATPVGWCLLVFRVLQNAMQDFRDFFGGRPLRLGTGLSEVD